MSHRSTLSLICFGPIVCGAPIFLYVLGYFLLIAPDFSSVLFGLQWGLVLLVLPIAAVGLVVGLIGYVCSRATQRFFNRDLPVPHALIVGAGSGAIGALPLGFLLSLTEFGAGLAISIIASGIYVCVVFTVYVLLWERRARRWDDGTGA